MVSYQDIWLFTTVIMWIVVVFYAWMASYGFRSDSLGVRITKWIMSGILIFMALVTTWIGVFG